MLALSPLHSDSFVLIDKVGDFIHDDGFAYLFASSNSGTVFADVKSMKPTKSRVLCPDCGKMKAVFDSEKAALKFIEYNTLDIVNNGGYAPQRVYYCDLCCGWHITSHKYHKYKTKNRETLDRCIEFERNKKEREERIKLQQKMEQQELRRQQRKQGQKSGKKIIPSKSPVAPFLTLSMSLAKDAISMAKVHNLEEARVLIENAVCQLNRAMNIRGANSTKNTFNTYLKNLSDLLYSESEPEISSLDSIMLQFTYLIDLNEAIFSYDPNVEGAYQFEVTPDNYDEFMCEREDKEIEDKKRVLQNIDIDTKLQEQLKEQQQIEDKKVQSEELIDLAYDEIILGDYYDAKKHLLEAIMIIESINDIYYRDMLTDDLKEVMDKLPSN